MDVIEASSLQVFKSRLDETLNGSVEVIPALVQRID